MIDRTGDVWKLPENTRKHEELGESVFFTVIGPSSSKSN